MADAQTQSVRSGDTGNFVDSPGGTNGAAFEGALVLVADDDPMVRMRASKSLAKGGFRVVDAGNGRDALALYQQHGPDLVLCDVLMPEMNGYEVCRAIRREPSSEYVPILMLTGLDDMSSIENAFSAGATDFAAKPLNWGLLPFRVRYALRSSRAMRELKRSEQRYALASEGANDGLWDWDLSNNRIYFSPRWKSMLGFSDADIGTDPEEWLNRVHPDDRSTVSTAISAHTNGEQESFESEYRIRTRTGNYEWMIARGLAVNDDAGKSYRMVGSQTNISKRKQAEQQLLFDAMHDSLTGLPNRALFLDRLQHSIQLAKRRQSYQFAVVFIDLDRFKVVNDSLGHLQGDRLLIEVAKRIKTILRVGDTLARLGGDEFTILCEEIDDITAVTRMVDRIMHELAKPIELQGQNIVSAASMGIAVSTTGYEKPEDMLRDADAAMYRAKASGSGNYELFDAKMHQQAVNILTLETHLRQALEQNQFRVHYQPIIELDTDRVSGFEALIRWQHPERGLMLPGEFLAVAEDARLIVPMGRWILRQACTQLRQWQTSWPEAMQWYMSVNISSAELASPGLVDYVAKTLQETRIPAQCLKLEITESSLITNGQRAHQIMQSLKSFGVQLSIDDFGTGYSSFNYLHRFPFDVLKIDASFVSNFDKDPERQEIVRTIISLAHNLGLSVVAEGSETSSDLASLRKLPCQFAQGYSISRPVDGDNMTRFLSDRLKVD